MNNSIEKIIRISIIILAVVLLFIIKTIDIIVPKLSLDTYYLEINVFDKYNGVGYNAILNGKDISSSVVIKGIVDTEHTGIYNITYEAYNGSYVTRKTLRVDVVDKKPPVIKLKYNKKNVDVCSDTTYENIEYEAYDKYDGDLTNKVEIIKDENKILYKVSDNSGNIATKEIVSEAFKVPPVIVLNGSDEVFVKQNKEYEELGAKAYDSCGKEITENIKIEGSVNTKEIGTYEISYQVTDNNNLTNVIKRKVVVYNEETTPGIIYLTFDDGPGPYTGRILDILAKYNIKATFFVTKNGSDSDILREYNEGHTIGLHTYTHNWKIYKSSETYFEDLNLIKERVKNLVGIKSNLIRFPGGSSNTVSKAYNKGIMTKLTKEVEEKGYKYFDWNVCVEDAGYCTKRKVKNKEKCVIDYFETGLSKTQINYVLLHDVKEYTANALEEMIKYAIDNNYQFLPITNDTVVHHHEVNN